MLEESECVRILTHLHEALPQVMKKAVIEWTKGETYLAAIQIFPAQSTAIIMKGCGNFSKTTIVNMFFRS
jgi:hypothetical protein